MPSPCEDFFTLPNKNLAGMSSKRLGRCLKGVIVNRVKTPNGIKCQVFCSRVENLITIHLQNYEIGTVCDFTIDEDGIVHDVVTLDQNRKLQFKIKNLLLKENRDETQLPFGLVGEDDIFGAILVPSSAHTQPGLTVDVIISYNNFMDMKYKWYAIKVYDHRAKTYTSILGCSSPLSLMSSTVPEEDSVDNLTAATLKSDAVEAASYTEVEASQDTFYDEDSIGSDNYNFMDLARLGKQPLPDVYRLFSNCQEPLIQFPIFPKDRPTCSEKMYEDRVIFLARCPDFAIALSSSAKEFGIMLPNHESYQLACLGNVSRCDLSIPNERVVLDFYSFIVEKVGTYINNWKLRSVLTVYGNTISLAVSVALRDEDIKRSPGDADGIFTFPFGKVMLDKKLNEYYSKSKKFAFRATLSSYDLSQATDDRVVWVAHHSHCALLP
ncbi:unnamed protein product [Bursaphelenchus xylophilus]|uniref:(pine wood nematode) hypothetical protein n=1 Tax=Bursaphelenchus xylophilus TaxID=6326 RepID=A0A1I7SSH7_BURXY|nr:unnamed protein product [Bursaphelenchus xylophilus]CAG9097536.1 unnamed protein product [Bursaphelenchus xylophilus]